MAEVLDIRLQRTRKALHDALLQALRSQPFEQISIRDITSAAGVGYATFYRHYASKEGLLHELADAEVRELMGLAMPAIFTTNMRASCMVVCSRVLENQGLWRAMLSGGASGVLREEFIRESRKLKGRYQDQFAGWLPEELHLICSTGATLDVLTWWLRQKPMAPPEEIAEILDRIIATLTTKPMR